MTPPDRDRDREGGQRALGWGLVGCGWVATDYVAPAIACSSNGRIVGVFDPDLDAARRLAERSGGPSGQGPVVHPSLDALLADPGVEAVYVATPNHVHAPVVVQAARAGKAILCEKPMATTLDDARAMVEASEAAGVPFATAFDQRHHSAHRKLRDLVAAGALGVVTQARIHYACWLPGDWSGDNWRVDPARAGGGALIDLAPHGIDLLETILGDEWAELSAMTQRRVHEYPVDDGAIVFGRFRSGTLATIHVGYNCPDRFPRRTLELIGTKAMAIASDTMGQTPGGRVELIDAESGARSEVDFARPGPGAPDTSPFVAQVEWFADSTLSRTFDPSTARGNLRTFALLEAACR